MIAGSVRGSAESVKETAAAFAEAGTDELVLCPTVPYPDEVDLAADAVL